MIVAYEIIKNIVFYGVPEQMLDITYFLTQLVFTYVYFDNFFYMRYLKCVYIALINYSLET